MVCITCTFAASRIIGLGIFECMSLSFSFTICLWTIYRMLQDHVERMVGALCTVPKPMIVREAWRGTRRDLEFYTVNFVQWIMNAGIYLL